MRKLLIALTSIFLLTAAVPASSVSAFNLFPDKICQSTDTGGSKSSVCEPAKDNKNPVARLIGSVVNLVALVAGAVAVLMIIIAGYQFVTSGGSAETVTKARSRITGALIGLIIIALAWTIIRIVMDTVIA
jgi:Type IV secretion system pilin